MRAHRMKDDVCSWGKRANGGVSIFVCMRMNSSGIFKPFWCHSILILMVQRSRAAPFTATMNINTK